MINILKTIVLSFKAVLEGIEAYTKYFKSKGYIA